MAACNGPASSIPGGPAAARPHTTAPHPGASATPIPFTFQTVDDPDSLTNEVTGINQLAKIVGVFYGGAGSTIPESYTTQPPFTSFKTINYPGAQGTFATSLSSNKIIAGYVIDPNSQLGIWSFVRINGLWSLFADTKEGTGSNALTEILGVDDSEYAVGYYLNNAGTKVPFELDIAMGTFTDLTPPGALSAEATAINGKSDVSGIETTSAGTMGFYLQSGTYYPISYPGAKATYALGINWQDQVVGNYLDKNGLQHGFVLTGPTRGGKQQFWQSIDEPKAALGTWVTDISNHDVICGYYIDKNSIQHGFIANP